MSKLERTRQAVRHGRELKFDHITQKGGYKFSSDRKRRARIKKQDSGGGFYFYFEHMDGGRVIKDECRFWQAIDELGVAVVHAQNFLKEYEKEIGSGDTSNYDFPDVVEDES